MATILPIERPIRWIAHGRIGDEDVLMDGMTQLGDLTGVAPMLDTIAADNDNEFLRQANEVAGLFPPLPPMAAPLETGSIYQHGDKCVIVRQTHTRTEHDPLATLNLFLVYREDAGDELPWIEGEWVYQHYIRVWHDKRYHCISAHMTVKGAEPDVAPALWELVKEAGGPWAQPAGAHDAYPVGAIVTHKGQTWKSTIDANVWEPGVYGWVVL
jgi:hypothetical protein